jgi:hypothetical protein
VGRNNHITSSFIAGEVSPKFLGRTDTQQYNQAAEEIRNMLVYPQGGAGRRPGTFAKYKITEVGGVTSPGDARVIPFYGTDGTRWQLMITDEKATLGVSHANPVTDHAWKAYNIDTGSVEAIGYEPGGPASGITAMADYYDLGSKGIVLSELQYAQSGDTLVVCHRWMRPFRVIYNPAATGANFIFEMTPLPYLFGPAQSAAYPDAGAGYYKQWAYNTLGEMFSDETLMTIAVDTNIAGDSPDAGNYNALLTFTGVTLTSDWIGRVFKVSHSSKTLVVQIYAIVSSSTANAVVIGGNLNADPTTFATAEIECGAWDDIHGWPISVGFYESRLVFGGTAYFPDKVWLSESDNIFNMQVRLLEQDPAFADPVVATDPFAFTLKQNIYSEIRWLAPDKTIIAGTNSAEFVIKGPDSSQSIGPTNVSNNPETPHGSAYCQSVKFENTNVFLQRDRRSLREMVFNLDENSFIAPNLNILAEHIAKVFARERLDGSVTNEYSTVSSPGAIVQMCKMEVPYGIIWCIDNNGCLLGLTRDRNQNVAAWHRHELGGALVSDQGDYNTVAPARIKSIATIQRPPLDTDGMGGEPDELWMVVERVHGGGATLWLEKMALEWEHGGTFGQNWDFDLDQVPNYMDFTVLRRNTDSDGLPDTTDLEAGVIKNLGSYFDDGREVTVIMNGYDLGEFEVSGGEVDISAYLDVSQLADVTPVQCLVGYNYTGRLAPVVPEVPATLGTSLGSIRRVDRVSVMFHRAAGARVGRVSDVYQENTPIDDPEEISFPRASDEDVDSVARLFSGELQVIFPNGYDRKPKVLIESYRPFPCQVTYIVARMTVNE